MNEKPTIDVNKVPRITKFIYTLGVLPTSYLMSMTYQEQLTWLCNYIQTTLIPAINTDVEAVQELQNLYELLREYVNDYFENLDVQEEINNKLDSMAQDGSLTQLIKNYVNPLFDELEQNVEDEITNQNTRITNEFTNQNARITVVENEVAAATSGSPLVASSTAGMTETDRVYVNTTDGKWYYYDGDSWEIGGTYQATGISETDPVIEGIDFKLTNLYDMTTIKNLLESELTNGNVTSSGNVTTSAGNIRTDYQPVSAETEYTLSWVSENSIAMNIAYFTSDKTFISKVYIGSKASNFTFTTPATAAYCIPIWGAVTTDDVSDAQLELGDTKTDYEEPFYYKIKSDRINGFENIVEDITDIKQQVYPLPSYYTEEISDVEGDVLDNITLNSTTFGLFTDIHFTSAGRTEYNPNMREIHAMRRLADDLPVHFTLDGGDIMTYSTHAFSIDTINKCMNTFSGCRCPHFVAKGDHDSAQSDTQITQNEFAARTYPYMPHIVKCPTAVNNYYYDIPSTKKRFICLDSGTSGAGGGTADLEKAYTWLLNDVFTNDVKNGWEFIIFSHMPFDYEWNVGMVRLGTFSGVRQTQVMMIDLANAINTAGTFTKTAAPAYEQLFYYDQYGVLTQDTTGQSVNILMGSLNTSYNKDFTGWSSKVKLLVSGHCHCDRLNKKTNGITYDFGIAYTASAQYGGYKNTEYYETCFGDEGRVAYWSDIENREDGTISEALMDIYIVNDDNIKKIRFGAGNSMQLNY